MAFFEEVGDFVGDYGLLIAGTAVGAAIGGPAGALAGASVGQAVQGGIDADQAQKRQAREASRIERETKARERSLLITSRREAMEGAPRVQYGGRVYGGPTSGATTLATDDLASPSLIARSEYTGLNIINPSLGVL